MKVEMWARSKLTVPLIWMDDLTVLLRSRVQWKAVRSELMMADGKLKVLLISRVPWKAVSLEQRMAV